MQREFALFKHLLQVHQHAFADACNGENFFGFADDIGDLLGLGFDGLGGVAIRADAKGVCAVNF